jgi:hypothetical protein
LRIDISACPPVHVPRLSIGCSPYSIEILLYPGLDVRLGLSSVLLLVITNPSHVITYGMIFCTSLRSGLVILALLPCLHRSQIVKACYPHLYDSTTIVVDKYVCILYVDLHPAILLFSYSSSNHNSCRSATSGPCSHVQASAHTVWSSAASGCTDAPQNMFLSWRLCRLFAQLDSTSATTSSLPCL